MRFLFVIITGSFLLLSDFSFSQIFIHPNFGLKSHETLVIEKVELTSIAATFFLSIENRIPNGSFAPIKISSLSIPMEPAANWSLLKIYLSAPTLTNSKIQVRSSILHSLSHPLNRGRNG